MYLYGGVIISIIFGFLPIGCKAQYRSAVHQDPAITVARSVNTIHVHKNDRLVLDCPVTSSANQLSYFWYKDDVEINQQRRVHVEVNGSLVIERVLNKRRKRNDAGQYECYVENNYGQILGRRVEVVITKATLSLVPSTYRAHVGDVARFECQLTGADPSPPEPRYIWQGPSTSGSNRLKLTKDDSRHLGVLQVYNVSKEDEGSYTCKVLYHDGMLEKSAFLQIEDSSGPPSPNPVLLDTSQHITVISGQTALLECLVQGGTRTRVSWQRTDGRPLFITGRLSVSGNSNLKIAGAQSEDEGTYICAVEHAGTSDIQRVYTLDVLVAPKFTEKVPLIVEHVLVQRRRLYCNVVGNPIPIIHWYKDGLKIFPTPQTVLVIHGRKDEIGYYQCLAENSVGYIISTTWVTFERKPDTPGEVKIVSAEPISSTVIQLKWEPSQSQNETGLMGYGIDYHKVSDMQCPGRCMHLFKRERDMSDYKLTSKNITGLEPYQLYAFSIQGINHNGAGAMSEERVLRTLEAVPTTVPDVQITPDTETSFRVLWTEIPRAKANGKINKHKLFYGTELKMEVTELKGDARDYLVIGLEPNTLYKVRVLAGNSAGYPDVEDNWITYQTPAKTKNYAAVTPVLTFEPINSSTVLIRWSHGSVEVGSYRIMIQNQLEGGRVHEYNISADKNKFIIGGLENRTFYKVDFMVKDLANNLVSMVTELYQSLNPYDTQEPPPPMMLDPDTVSSSSIHVSWKRPKTSLDITSYTVRYQQRHGEELVANPTLVESSNQMVRLAGLQSYTWYVISVRSHTTNDYGPYSKPVIVQTLEGIPSPPENIFAEVVSPGTVKLKWGPPRRQNGVITYYIIYYNHDKNVPERAWTSIQQNASTTSVVVNDLARRIYYFKLRACTKAGEGNSSNVIEINPLDCGAACPTCTEHACYTEGPVTSKQANVFQQQLGIIIGCMVGLVCCIICVTVIVIKHRSYRRLRAATYGPTSSEHQVVGRYLSQGNTEEAMSLATSHPPFLNGHIVENTNSDSKGGHYVMFRGEPDQNLILISGAQASQLPNGRQLPAERRALLSPSSSSSHGNDTSSIPTLDTGTLGSSFSTPGEEDVTGNRITSCDDSPMLEEHNGTSCTDSPVQEGNNETSCNSPGLEEGKQPPECSGDHSGDKNRDHPIERSHSGSRDSGFEIDMNGKACENEKLCSNTDFNETHPHLNINC